MGAFTLDAFSDREFLHLVWDIADEDGWTTGQKIAVRAGLGAAGTGNVGTRLGWMRRYGIVEKTTRFGNPTRWCLTHVGEQVRAANALPPSVLSSMALLDDAEIVWAAHSLAVRFQAAGGPYADLTRREWQREIRRQARGG